MKKQETDTSKSSAGTTSVAVNFTFFVLYMAALSAFGSFVNDMFVPAMPEMRDAFKCSVSTIQLGLTMGMAGLALGQFVLGPVSDKYGRKPTLMWSLVVFMVAGVVSIFSPDVWFFLVCRFFQGLGASGGYFIVGLHQHYNVLRRAAGGGDIAGAQLLTDQVVQLLHNMRHTAGRQGRTRIKSCPVWEHMY